MMHKLFFPESEVEHISRSDTRLAQGYFPLWTQLWSELSDFVEFGGR